ncbi:MAG: hypothetical protein WAN16_11060 [Chthoniobacterales bacterium]
MQAAENHLLIFEGASAGRYPQRSRPSEQRSKNRQMASALRVAEIQAKGHKALGFVAWHGGQMRWLGTLLARPLLRIRYGSPLRGCSSQAALPAASSSRNGLYAIKSAFPKAQLITG